MLKKLLFILLLTTTFAHAQVPDSITHKLDSLQKANSTRLESKTSHLNNTVDSIQLRLNNVLNPNLNQLTSKLKPRKLSVPDSLKAVDELTSAKNKLTTKIDSLNALKLPTNKYTRQLDSISQITPARYIETTQNKINAFEDKATKPLTDVTQKINSNLDVVRQEGGPQANIPGAIETDIPIDIQTKIDLPNSDINLSNATGKIDNPLEGKTGDLSDIQQKANGLTSVPQQQIDKLKSIDEINTVQSKVGDLNQATDQVQSYSSEIKNVASGDLSEVKDIPNAIEDKAKNLDAIKDLEKQNAEIAKMTEQIGAANDPEAMKKLAVQQVKAQARNHFEGKAEVLQAAMDKLAKVKAKYPNAASINDLSKRAPNPMKGKPLVERIVPGLTFQILKEHNVMIDLNPVVAYRITGRINAGLGWNERLSFSRWNKLEPGDRIYGPRVFGSYNFKKGFSVKTDIERMNAFVPPFAITPDAGSRKWLWSAFVGIKKDYRILKSLNGNVQILYNIYDDHDNSPYSDRLNVRMGFEFPIKKVKKASTR